MRSRNVSNQAPATVSLADVSQRLRHVATVLRHFGGIPKVTEDLGVSAPFCLEQAPLLDALASSLEQTQGPSANICSNEDTVTITLSRKDATNVAFLTEKEGRTFEEWAHTYAAAGHEVRSRGHDESAARWKNITDTIRASALQPTTPQRRE